MSIYTHTGLEKGRLIEYSYAVRFKFCVLNYKDHWVSFSLFMSLFSIMSPNLIHSTEYR